jgi:hypothetical protein
LFEVWWNRHSLCGGGKKCCKIHNSCLSNIKLWSVVVLDLCSEQNIVSSYCKGQVISWQNLMETLSISPLTVNSLEIWAYRNFSILQKNETKKGKHFVQLKYFNSLFIVDKNLLWLLSAWGYSDAIESFSGAQRFEFLLLLTLI